MQGDVETIQHVQGVTHFGRQNVQVRLPHVAAHKPYPLDDFRAERFQASPQSGLRAAAAYPQQAPAVLIDLVDHRQVVVCALPAPPMKLVDPDGLDLIEEAMIDRKSTRLN